jgi:hypothetical protein
VKQFNIKTVMLSTWLLSGFLIQAQHVYKPGPGSATGWKLLGTTHAKHMADHDAIIVAGPYDFFGKLKFKVTDAPLNMQRMIVRYDDGLPENIEVRNNIPKGGESRVIDLKGGKRKLKSIEFWYDTKGLLNGTADVSLFAMR